MPDERLSAFGDRIRRERERRGLSQEDLAKLAGLSRTTINRAERGVINLRVVNAVCIAQGLGMTPQDLFTAAS